MTVTRIERQREAARTKATVVRELRAALRSLTAAADAARDPLFTELIAELREPIATAVQQIEGE